MADELKYIVQFEVGATYDDVKKKIDELEDAKREAIGQEDTEGVEDYTGALKELAKVSEEGVDRLIDLRKVMDEQRRTISSLNKEKKETGDIDRDSRRREEEAHISLKESTRLHRETQAQLVATAMKGNKAGISFNELAAQTRVLETALKNLPMDATEGEFKRLQNQITKNKQQLKMFDKDLGNHQRNVGNYSEAWSIAASSIATFQGPLGPIAGRLTALNSTLARSVPILKAKAVAWGMVATAMAMTGIPIIAAAIVLLVKALRRSQAVIDWFAKSWATVGAAVENVTERLGSFFGILEGTNESMRDATRRARDLADAKAALRDRNIELIVEEAKLQKQIASLRLDAEDETRAYEERLGLIKQAQDEIRTLFDLQIEQAEWALANLEAEYEGTSNTAEENERLAEAKAKITRLEEQRDTQLRTITRRQTAFTNSLRREEEQRQRLLEQERRQIEQARRAHQERMAQLREQGRAAIDDVQFNRRIGLLRREGKEIEALREIEKRELLELDRLGREKIEEMNQRVEDGHATRGQIANEHLQLQETLAEKELAIRTKTENQINDVIEGGEKRRAEIREQYNQLIERNEMMRVGIAVGVAEGESEELARLYQERYFRILDLQEAFVQAGFDQTEAANMARLQSETEFEERIANTKKAIRDREVQEAIERADRLAKIAISGGTILFGENKAIMTADAIIAAILSAMRARAQAPIGMKSLAFASEMAIGAANVARIARTKVGDTSVTTGDSVMGVERTFQLVNREPTDTPVATAVAEQEVQPSQPEIVLNLEGDLDPEFLAIKVRHGNRTINSRTPTFSTRQ